MSHRLFKRDSKHAFDNNFVAQTNAQTQSTLRGRIHGVTLLRNRQWMPRISRHDTRAEFDSWHLSTDYRQGRQRIVTKNIWRPITCKSVSLDLSCLVPAFLPAFPADPSAMAPDTGYVLAIDLNGRYTVSAPQAELGADISVTR